MPEARGDARAARAAPLPAARRSIAALGAERRGRTRLLLLDGAVRGLADRRSRKSRLSEVDRALRGNGRAVLM